MSFASGFFLIALAGAAGPIIIHLLNRQRYRTVEWAPMEFLLRAVRHRRRRVQLRDLLLLLMRTLAIVFFVLAMARPIWTTHGPGAYRGQPVHAILVIDNSLSMAYTPFDRSHLEIARDKATQFIRDLPAGSDATVIPMCEQSDARFAEVYDSRDDAMDAVARIEIVDRAAHLDVVLAGVRRASELPGTAPIKRPVIFSDMQQETWDNASDVNGLDALGEVQYVAIRSEHEGPEPNSWVAGLDLRGGYAESGTPAVFDAVIRHDGPQGRNGVRAVLSVGGDVVDEKHIDLAAGQEKHVSFDYTFEAPGGAVDPTFVPVNLELEGDRLPLDDRRYYVAAVFQRAPVLFVDQHGEFEQPEQNRYGETFPLRLLYASRLGTAGQAIAPQLRLQPITIDEINGKLLKEVRLAVVAGVAEPTAEAVQLLRGFVERGGQLLITAGAQFEPEEWTAVAWQQGTGILPAPLASELLGSVPKPGGDPPKMFHLDVASLQRDVFDLQLSDSEWQGLAGAPFFFQAVRVEESRLSLRESVPAVPEAETANFRGAKDDFATSHEARDNSAHFRGAKGDYTRVVGRYDNGEPFAVHGRIGDGNVVLVTTGCFPTWNNLAVAPEGGILLYDQILGWLLRQSIPACNFVERRELVMPVDRRDQNARFQLVSTSDSRQVSLAVEAIASDEFTVVARGIDRRDVFAIQRHDAATAVASHQPRQVFSFAVNGSSEESNLTAIAPEAFQQDGRQWLGADEAIPLAGGGSVERELWLYLLALAICCLVAEMVIASSLLGFRRQRTEVPA